MDTEPRYGIEELADLGGVSRRAVRFYVQEGLIPPPLGLGRGRHYGTAHLDRLLRVKQMQEQGLTLAEIHDRLAAGVSGGRPLPAPPKLPRSAWVRVELLPGIEVHVSSAWKLPPPGRLAEMSERCREWFRPSSEEDADE
jgi:DNA-binding transcriptional MerR regulator